MVHMEHIVQCLVRGAGSAFSCDGMALNQSSLIYSFVAALFAESSIISEQTVFFPGSDSLSKLLVFLIAQCSTNHCSDILCQLDEILISTWK